MRIPSSLIFSISIHLILIILFLLFFPEMEPFKKEERVKVELIVKKEEKAEAVENKTIRGDDIIERNRSINSDISIPHQTEYLISFLNEAPDLIISNRESIHNDNVGFSGFDIDNFEESLADLLPVEDFVYEDSEDTGINWEGDSRTVLYNSTIDFSSFPKESFTGVGVKAEFMVNPEGEVYSVNIVPPGSGSVEFDILIKQYVTRFKFEKGETNSKGEIFIVYK